MAKFDVNRTEITESDTKLPKGAGLGGYTPVLEAMTTELDFLTNTLKDQLTERLERLERRERDLLQEIGDVSSFVEDEVASEDRKLRAYGASNELKAVRLDILDTTNALAMLEIQDVAIPSSQSWTADGIVTTDNREDHT